jgi:hypothetical protein
MNATVTPLPNPTPVFIDPLSYEAYLKWLNSTDNGTLPQNPDYIEGHPETASGYLIYTPPSPTPTPTPTPDPLDGMIHQRRDVSLIDLGYNAEQNGYLTLIPLASNDTGVFPYYSIGDRPVFHLKFSCRNPVEYVNPIVEIQINKIDDYGHEVPGWSPFCITLIDTIPAAEYTYDGELCQASTWEFTADPGFYIPPFFTDSKGVKTYTKGMYMIHFTIWTPEKDLVLDKISHETTILPNEMI